MTIFRCGPERNPNCFSSLCDLSRVSRPPVKSLVIEDYNWNAHEITRDM